MINDNELIKELHKLEMDLVFNCEDNEVLKEIVINKFTDLYNKLK